MANYQYEAFRQWFDQTIVDVPSNKDGITDEVRRALLKAWNAGAKHALSGAPDDWDAGVLACWQIAHGWDEKCCGPEGIMAHCIATDIEALFRVKPEGV